MTKVDTSSETGGLAHAWLSRDLSTFAIDKAILPGDRGAAAEVPDLDVMIVGSGYGGSMALAELAGYGTDGQPLEIGLFERGDEHLPGAFPRRMEDLAGHIRFSRPDHARATGRPEGLFDLRLGGDVNTLLANGLGGGSLINAGVMARPHASVMRQSAWPRALRDAPQDELDAHFQHALDRLAVAAAPDIPLRSRFMQALGGDRSAVPQVAIRLAPGEDGPACRACGDCFTGCNVGAKQSLDATVIAQAVQRHPAAAVHIVTGATTLWIEQEKREGGPSFPNGIWRVHVVHTDRALRDRLVHPYVIRTRHLVLAAGVMGSTEIMLRSRDKGLPMSGRVGHRFSTNGDSVALVHGLPHASRSVADEDRRLGEREVGPTITRMVDLRSGSVDEDMVAQDLAIPGAMRWVYEEASAMGRTLHALSEADDSRHDPANPHDPAAIDADEVARSMLVALMGHDDASGRLTLTDSRQQEETPGDGAITVTWPELQDDPRFGQRHQRLKQMLARAYPEAVVLPNPLRKPLPPILERIFGVIQGPAITAHPLGGCAMAERGGSGVVNHLGQVFDGPGPSVYANLQILDGAIVPGSLGINPALTIAALAARAVAALRDTPGAQGLCGGVQALHDVHATALPPRPRARPDDDGAAGMRDSRPTMIEFTERLDGEVLLTEAHGGQGRPHRVEIELWFEPVAVRTLTRAASGGGKPLALTVDRDRSRLRIRPPLPGPAQAGPGADPGDPGGPVSLCTHLSGTLSWFPRAASTSLERRQRGLEAWWMNRGQSDIAKHLYEAVNQDGPGIMSLNAPWLLQDWLARGQGALGLASHAGGVRLLQYELKIEPQPDGDEGQGAWAYPEWDGRPISLTKRLCYELAGNPIKQLTRASLTAFPHREARDFEARVFHVSSAHMRNKQVPLLRVVGQRSQPQALADLASLLTYVLRVLMPIHTWSLRLPDYPDPRPVQRLPGAIRGTPHPEHSEIEVARRDGRSVCLRLTRYHRQQGPDDGRPPVLLIHGYSASGTTFAHPALPEGGLAGHLRDAGRDVWVLDLRSSAGMPHATVPWVFEEMAYQDIPLAVDEVLAATGRDKIDIVAHCMGGAMLSLALLGEPGRDNPRDVYRDQRRKLPDRIARIVFSQVGPALVLAPGNVARAHLMNWFRHYLQLGPYELQPVNRTRFDEILDRLFALVPYPDEEFPLENPNWPVGLRTPWVSTRHRMDALYGRTFNLRHMSSQVLAHIDDFFGPLNLITLAEVLNYARFGLITDHEGSVGRIGPDHVAAVFESIGVLSVHSGDNGLIDHATRDRMRVLLGSRDVGDPAHADKTRARHLFHDLPDMGHQDSLIGQQAPHVYRVIASFLQE